MASHASLHLIYKEGKIFEKRAFFFSTISLRFGNRPKGIASLVDLNLPQHFLSPRGACILNFSRDYPPKSSPYESRAEIRGRYTVARKSNRIRVTWDLQDAKRADSPPSLSLVSLLRWLRSSVSTTLAFAGVQNFRLPAREDGDLLTFTPARITTPLRSVVAESRRD